LPRPIPPVAAGTLRSGSQQIGTGRRSRVSRRWLKRGLPTSVGLGLPSSKRAKGARCRKDLSSEPMRPHIRPLTEAEIESLEQALGKPVARKDLVYWVSKSIEDMVRLASKPTPRRLRDSLLQFEREGREWLTDIAESESASFLAARANLPEFTAAASAFCDQVASLAREVHCLVRPGRSCTPARSAPVGGYGRSACLQANR
jgi:hypothetical protein